MTLWPWPFDPGNSSFIRYHGFNPSTVFDFCNPPLYSDAWRLQYELIRQQRRIVHLWMCLLAKKAVIAKEYHRKIKRTKLYNDCEQKSMWRWNHYISNQQIHWQTFKLTKNRIKINTTPNINSIPASHMLKSSTPHSMSQTALCRGLETTMWNPLTCIVSSLYTTYSHAILIWDLRLSVSRQCQLAYSHLLML